MYRFFISRSIIFFISILLLFSGIFIILTAQDSYAYASPNLDLSSGKDSIPATVTPGRDATDPRGDLGGSTLGQGGRSYTANGSTGGTKKDPVYKEHAKVTGVSGSSKADPVQQSTTKTGSVTSDSKPTGSGSDKHKEKARKRDTGGSGIQHSTGNGAAAPAVTPPKRKGFFNKIFGGVADFFKKLFKGNGSSNTDTTGQRNPFPDTSGNKNHNTGTARKPSPPSKSLMTIDLIPKITSVIFDYSGGLMRINPDGTREHVSFKPEDDKMVYYYKGKVTYTGKNIPVNLPVDITYKLDYGCDGTIDERESNSISINEPEKIPLAGITKKGAVNSAQTSPPSVISKDSPIQYKRKNDTPLPNGLNCLSITVDADNKIKETNEENNQSDWYEFKSAPRGTTTIITDPPRCPQHTQPINCAADEVMSTVDAINGCPGTNICVKADNSAVVPEDLMFEVKSYVLSDPASTNGPVVRITSQDWSPNNIVLRKYEKLAFRWDASKYDKCLTFINPETYVFDQSTTAVTGNTEKSGIVIKSLNKTYSIECTTGNTTHRKEITVTSPF